MSKNEKKNLSQEILNLKKLKSLRAKMTATDMSSRKNCKIHRKISQTAITTTTQINDSVFVETEFMTKAPKSLANNEVNIFIL